MLEADQYIDLRVSVFLVYVRLPDGGIGYGSEAVIAERLRVEVNPLL